MWNRNMCVRFAVYRLLLLLSIYVGVLVTLLFLIPTSTLILFSGLFGKIRSYGDVAPSSADFFNPSFTFFWICKSYALSNSFFPLSLSLVQRAAVVSTPRNIINLRWERRKKKNSKRVVGFIFVFIFFVHVFAKLQWTNAIIRLSLSIHR